MQYSKFVVQCSSIIRNCTYFVIVFASRHQRNEKSCVELAKRLDKLLEDHTASALSSSSNPDTNDSLSNSSSELAKNSCSDLNSRSLAEIFNSIPVYHSVPFDPENLGTQLPQSSPTPESNLTPEPNLIPDMNYAYSIINKTSSNDAGMGSRSSLRKKNNGRGKRYKIFNKK